MLAYRSSSRLGNCPIARASTQYKYGSVDKPAFITFCLYLSLATKDSHYVLLVYIVLHR